MIRQLPAGFALVIRGGCAPVIARLPRAWKNPAYRRARRLGPRPVDRNRRWVRVRGGARAGPPDLRARRVAPRRRHLVPLELTMTSHDPITAIADQLAAHAGQLTRLEAREDEHSRRGQRPAAEPTDQAAALGRVVGEHAAALTHLAVTSQTDPDPAVTAPGRQGTGVVEAGGRRPFGTGRPAAGLGRAGLPARLRAPGRRPRRLLAFSRPVLVRAGHRSRAVVGAEPAACAHPGCSPRPNTRLASCPPWPNSSAPRPTAAATPCNPAQASGQPWSTP